MSVDTVINIILIIALLITGTTYKFIKTKNANNPERKEQEELRRYEALKEEERIEREQSELEKLAMEDAADYDETEE